jgi:excisionase family DNA binding protein
MMSADQLLTVHEVAELLSLSVGSVYHLISEKRIPVVKLSARCVRFERNALEAWIASLAVPADSNKPIPMMGTFPARKKTRKTIGC